MELQPGCQGPAFGALQSMTSLHRVSRRQRHCLALAPFPTHCWGSGSAHKLCKKLGHAPLVQFGGNAGSQRAVLSRIPVGLLLSQQHLMVITNACGPTPWRQPLQGCSRQLNPAACRALCDSSAMLALLQTPTPLACLRDPLIAIRVELAGLSCCERGSMQAVLVLSMCASTEDSS